MCERMFLFTMPFLCADSGPWRKMSRESAWGTAEARQENVIAEKGHCCREMLEHVLNTSTNVFCQYCPRQEGLNREAVLRRRCQSSWASPITILDRRGPVNESIMFGELSILLLFFIKIFRSVHGCLGMDVWVNAFTMPFLYADSGPWRKMSRAWPPMSAIMTSSGSTCPSHQESAWGTAEARQEKVIVQVVRKAIVVGKCWSMCWTHLQMFSVSTVLGKKASTVEQSWGEGANLPGRRPSPYWTGRGPVNESIMFGELSILLLLFL